MNGITPKMIELMEWEKIEQVDEMLDRGENPRQVHRWITGNGFNISHPVIYQYADLRKKAVINGITMEKLITNVRQPGINKKAASFKRRKDLALNELEILDEIIQRGYKYLINNPDFTVSIPTLMKAISLKNELTEGTHDNLTIHGMNYLTMLEEGKFQLLMNILLNYVPEDLREVALADIEEAEEAYYKDSEFYDDFLQAKAREESKIM